MSVSFNTGTSTQDHRGSLNKEEELCSTSVKIRVTGPQQMLIKDAQPESGSFSHPSPQTKSRFLPSLFERASCSWWEPKFDSSVLEEQYHRSTFPQLCQRFQYLLLYLFLVSVSYSIYFACIAKPNWIPFVVVSFTLMCYTIVALLFTYTQHYQTYYFPISLGTTVLLCALSLLAFSAFINNPDPMDSDISSVGLFCICIEVLLLIYTVIPMPLYLCSLIGGSYSLVFEGLSALLTPDNLTMIIIVKVLLHICIHLMGIHMLLMAEVRMRHTFMKVGQSLLVRRDLEIEKHLKEKMIHSVMPPKVASWLMSTQDGDEDDGINSPTEERRISASPRQSQMVFRPFNMHCMDNVSILFADIVGFTKMSSNKTAEQLVGLLNDLFGRFDYLCSKLGCEKISTLGDCYYCVSGCPEPRPDHAKCCVEMGLGMIKAIGEFDEDTNETVNMRVGVHTGTVLCGIVGTCRFKFDVWSNDVSFANLMESTGKPGQVHISDSTYQFLQHLYTVDEGAVINSEFIVKNCDLLVAISITK